MSQLEFSQAGRAGKFFSVSARDDLWRFQRSAIPLSGHFFVWSWLIFKFFFVFTAHWLGCFHVSFIGSNFACSCRMRYGADFDEYILTPGLHFEITSGCSAVEGN